MFSIAHMDESDTLAPFRYEGRLAKLFGTSEAKGAPPEPQFAESLLTQAAKKNNAQPTAMDVRAAEEERRRHWHHEHGFDGAKATTVERMAEEARRARYEAELRRLQHPLVPSIPTADNTRR